MVLAVASMTAFYSCGPSAEDQAKAEDMANELVGSLDEAVETATDEVTEDADTTAVEANEDAEEADTTAVEATEDAEEAPVE